MKYRDLKKSIIEPKIAEGGQGKIFEIRNRNSLFKLYTSPELVSADSLRAMAAWYANLSKAEQQNLSLHLAWPTEVIEHDDGNLAGFLMPRAPEQCYVKEQGDSSSEDILLNFDFLMCEMRPAWRKWLPLISATQRLNLIESFLNVVGWLHDQDYIIGDISGANIAWRPDNMQVFFMDCDAFMRSGLQPASPQAETPGFADPDPLPGIPTGQSVQDSDLYKVALVVMRTATQLMNIVPDGSVDSSAEIRQQLSKFQSELGIDHIYSRFLHVWRQAGQGGGMRPTVEEWKLAIKNERGFISVPKISRDESQSPRWRPRESRPLL